MVTIINGANENHLPVSGRTIAAVRASLAASLSIDPQAQARVNGEVVTEDKLLYDGDTLEFVKMSGEKG